MTLRVLSVLLLVASTAVETGPISGRQAPPAAPTYRIPESQALELLVEAPRAVYPDLARVTGVEMVVTLLIVIGTDGRVDFIEVQRGHPFLDQAAIDAVKGRRFKPSQVNGVPTAAITLQSILFALPTNLASSSGGAAAGATLAPRCEALAIAGLIDDAKKMCAQAEAASESLPRTVRESTRPSLDLALGTLALQMSDPNAAIRHLTQVVNALRQYTLFTELRAQALRRLAAAHAASGDLRRAASTCGPAEREMKKGRDSAGRALVVHQDRTVMLRDTILECAAIHAKARNAKDAEAARKRAAELSVH